MPLSLSASMTRCQPSVRFCSTSAALASSRNVAVSGMNSSVVLRTTSTLRQDRLWSKAQCGVGERVATPHRSEDKDRRKRSAEIQDRHRVEHAGPRSRRLHEDVPERHEQSGYSLGTVEQPVDLANVSGAECVPGGGAEKTVDLAPREEDHAREHDKRPGIAAVPAKRQDAHGFERKRDEHHHLAA